MVNKGAMTPKIVTVRIALMQCYWSGLTVSDKEAMYVLEQNTHYVSLAYLV